MQTMLLWIRRFLVGLSLVYGAGILVLLLFLAAELPSFWWFDLLDIFTLYFFAPLLLLIPCALLVRSWILRGVVAILTVIFLVLFGEQLVPPPAPEQRADLRVITFNALYTNRQIDAVIEVIQRQDADIVALQELSIPVASAIQQRLVQEFPYQRLEPASGSEGLGIISRYPFRDIVPRGGVRWQYITLEIADQPVELINVHLEPPHYGFCELPLLKREVILCSYATDLRNQQARQALDLISGIEIPLVVLGDFNTSDREQLYTQYATRLHDAYREAGWGFGFTFPNTTAAGPLPVPFPLIRIDYVWSSNGVIPVSSYTLCGQTGSDHCMVVADLALTEARATREPQAP